jgi:hypothetical protein
MPVVFGAHRGFDQWRTVGASAPVTAASPIVAMSFTFPPIAGPVLRHPSRHAGCGARVWIRVVVSVIV